MAASFPIPLATIAKYLQSAPARDKVNKVFAYFTKYLIWRMKLDGGDKDTIARLSKFNKTVGTARKMMRVGRPVEFIQAILEATSNKDTTAQALVITKNIGLTGWLYYDMYEWFHAAGVTILPDPKAVKMTGAWWWLLGLAAALVLSVYELQKNATAMQKAKKNTNEAERRADIKALQAKRAKLLKSVFTGFLNILVPSQRLGLVPLEDGYIGLVGTCTGLMGVYDEWVKVAKKK